MFVYLSYIYMSQLFTNRGEVFPTVARPNPGGVSTEVVEGGDISVVNISNSPRALRDLNRFTQGRRGTEQQQPAVHQPPQQQPAVSTTASAPGSVALFESECYRYLTEHPEYIHEKWRDHLLEKQSNLIQQAMEFNCRQNSEMLSTMKQLLSAQQTQPQHAQTHATAATTAPSTPSFKQQIPATPTTKKAELQQPPRMQVKIKDNSTTTTFKTITTSRGKDFKTKSNTSKRNNKPQIQQPQQQQQQQSRNLIMHIPAAPLEQVQAPVVPVVDMSAISDAFNKLERYIAAVRLPMVSWFVYRRAQSLLQHKSQTNRNSQLLYHPNHCNCRRHNHKQHRD